MEYIARPPRGGRLCARKTNLEEMPGVEITQSVDWLPRSDLSSGPHPDLPPQTRPLPPARLEGRVFQ